MTIPVLVGPVLLGKRVELLLARSYNEERGVVVGVSLKGKRALRLVPERSARYDEALGVWFPTKPIAEQWERSQEELLRVTVIDRIEQKEYEP